MGSMQAQQYHSVIFGNKNSWDDWHLIPSSRPEFASPKARQKFIQIPGKSGLIDVDITEAVVGEPTYESRTGTLDFIVANDYGNWEDRYIEIMSYLHGRTLPAILEDDPDYFYIGLFEVSEWKSGKDNSTISIKYTVDPFKLDIEETDTGELEVSGERTIQLDGLLEHGCPTIEASAEMVLLFNNTFYNVSEGTSRHPLMRMEPGTNTFVFRGNGTVRITYRGGIL